MFNRYYQEELGYLNELAVEFSRMHPALAPSLSGQTTDPDVERLLEGVAFSTGMLRQKLEDDFPEIIHGLMDIIFPHYLRPLPAATIAAFKPKPSLSETITVSRGAGLASVPVEGTSCRFKTCFDVDVHPLSLTDAKLVEQPGQATQIQLSFQLTAGDLSAWRPNRLRLFIGGPYPDASNLHFLLNRHTARIIFRAKQGGRDFEVSPDMVKPAGFAFEEALIPYPQHAFPGYRLLQEYFLLPHKFLFMDILGMDRWTDHGGSSEFEIIFELRDLPFYPSQVKTENFVLFACPIINIFDHSADPIQLDHRQTMYHVRPSGGNGRHYQIFSVDGVTGIARGTVQAKTYVPFALFEKQEADQPVYQLVRRPSIIDQSTDIFLSLPYAERSGTPIQETLTIDLSCTNGLLPEHLQLGDISQPTSSSPLLVDFKNIIPATAPVTPTLGNDMLWRLLSHLSLNYLSLADTGNLKALLQLYIFPEGRDKSKIAANNKRISGIDKITVTPADRLISRHMMRGQQIHLDLRQDHFAGPGDMVIFSSVLDYFLGVYAGINSFTHLSIHDTITGDRYTWPPRVGDRHLL